MRVVFLSLIALLGASASAQSEETTPAACRPDAQGRIDYQACADASPPGSPARTWALMNLGTQAYLAHNFSEAARLYELAAPNGRDLYSDAHFHAFYAGALAHVGRRDVALIHAKRSLAVLRGDPAVPAMFRQRVPTDNVTLLEYIYVSILPVLYAAQDPEFPAARDAYLSLPATDWMSLANRAGVLDDIGDIPGAIALSTRVLALEPNHPAVLNNHCFILTRGGRAEEALPFCAQAVALAPDVGPVHHSYATAFAALGRCAEAEAELAVARRIDPGSALYREAMACTSR